MNRAPSPERPTLGVLFDLDGVLLDTESLYTRATESIVSRFGKTYDFALKTRTMGRDARVGARWIIETLGLSLTVDEFLNERRPLLERLLATAEVMTGAEELVRDLHARRIPMAVATSSNRDLYEIKVRRHRFFELFQAVVCGDDPRVKSKKPAPDIFLAAAADISRAPRDCIVFEDSPAGVEGAVAAGMYVIALRDSAMDPARLIGAHRIVSAFCDVQAGELEAQPNRG